MVIGKRLHSHNSTVYKARPDGEPDEASVCEGVLGSEDEEDPECCVNGEDHFKVIGTTLSVP